MRRLLVVGFLWTLASTAWAEAKPEPRVTVRLSQRVGIAPVRVRVIATVRDDHQELRCPGFRLDYGDGSSSSQQSDCDPYGQEEERPHLWVIKQPRGHVYYVAGEYDVTFSILGQQGLTDLQGSARLIVTGPDPLPSSSRIASREEK